MKESADSVLEFLQQNKNIFSEEVDVELVVMKMVERACQEDVVEEVFGGKLSGGWGRTGVRVPELAGGFACTARRQQAERDRDRSGR